MRKFGLNGNLSTSNAVGQNIINTQNLSLINTNGTAVTRPQRLVLLQ
jgi:hypothetical protein